MNWDRIQGQWKQMQGSVKSKWGQLTDDDLTQVAGQKDKLVGRIQERYGIAKDEAQRQVDEWDAADERDVEAHAKAADRKAS